eukprot:gene2716-3912_t
MTEVTFGEGPFYTLNKKIARKELPEFGGYGLYATEPIKKGEICWRGVADDNMMEKDIEEVEKWEEEEKENFHHYAYQISKTRMRGVKSTEKDFSIFCNHSCEPTNWFDGNDFEFVASRDIKEGEDITFDYGTSETFDTTIEECLCGAKTCRKYITSSDWKKKELRMKYKGHFAPYIEKMIDEEVLNQDEKKD